MGDIVPGISFGGLFGIGDDVKRFFKNLEKTSDLKRKKDIEALIEAGVIKRGEENIGGGLGKSSQRKKEGGQVSKKKTKPKSKTKSKTKPKSKKPRGVGVAKRGYGKALTGKMKRKTKARKKA